MGAGKAGGRVAEGEGGAFCSCTKPGILLPRAAPARSRRNCDIFLPGMMSFGDAGTGLALSFVSRGSGEREVPELQRLPPSVRLCGA